MSPHVSALQVLAAVGIGVGLALLFRLLGWAIYVSVCWHLDRVDADIDAVLERPRD